jgi:hypothetical protein
MSTMVDRLDGDPGRASGDNLREGHVTRRLPTQPLGMDSCADLPFTPSRFTVHYQDICAG